MPIKKVWPSCRSTNLAIKVRVRSFGSCRLSKKEDPANSSENSTTPCPSQRQAFARQFMVFVPGICCSAVVVRIYSLKAKKSPICKLSLVHRATAHYYVGLLHFPGGGGVGNIRSWAPGPSWAWKPVAFFLLLTGATTARLLLYSPTCAWRRTPPNNSTLAHLPGRVILCRAKSAKFKILTQNIFKTLSTFRKESGTF